MALADVLEQTRVHCKCLPFTEIPHTTRLFADFLYHFDRVRSFYSRSPLNLDWAAAQAGLIQTDEARRRRVADILERQNRGFGASAAVLSNIDRMRNGASTVVTGQQVGLFGGPAYSLYKALSAIKVADEFTRKGVNAVPVFWLATEDHDFAEVATAVLPVDGALARVGIESSATLADVPVGGMPLGEQIVAAVEKAREVLGDSDVAALLQECYTPAQTLGSAFARLFSRAFSSLGLVVVDPSDPELHRVAAPIFAQAIARSEELNSAVMERGKALDSAGYHQQVKVTGASTFLFRMVGGERVALRRANGGFAAGSEKFTAQELAARAEKAPEEFSAAVLLRPVLQDYLLSTVAGVGGPAEIAYYAQAGPLYERLLGRVTPILPRFSATIVDPQVGRLLDKYGVELSDLLKAERPAEALASRALPQDVEEKFAVAREALDASLAGITESLDALDHTLVEAGQRAGEKMRHQLEQLRGRATRAQLLRSEIIARHAEQITASLLPDRTLQERLITGIALLARHGLDLLPQLLEVVRPECPDHRVVRL